MPQIYFEGELIELSEHGFLSLLKWQVGALYTAARTFCSSHVGGFGDIDRQWDYWTQTSLNNLQTLIPQIDDIKLREMFSILYLLAQKVYRRDRRVIERIAEIVNLPPPETKQDLQKLKRRLRKYEGLGPAWVAAQPEFFDDLKDKALQDGAALEKIKQRIDKKLNQLGEAVSKHESFQGPVIVADPTTIPSNIRRHLRPFNWYPQHKFQFLQSLPDMNAIEELGDQRAKDLIDHAQEELDAERAVRLLRGALRFGDRGVQASKAYLYLAMRYEDLNDLTKATECYTKSMDAWRPSAIVFFWRGLLHYKLKNWTEARIDFEQALSFSLDEALLPAERRVAEQYLVDLSKSS